MKLVIHAFTGAILLATALSAPAHMLWVNVVESEDNGHFLAFMGHGHLLPMEETLAPDYGAVALEHYDIVAPDGRRASLHVPEPVIPARNKTPIGVAVQDGGDIGLRKITLEKDASEGTYQIAAATPISFFVRYKDKTGAERFANTPVAGISDLDSVISSTVYANYMKAQFTIGEGTLVTPAPVGHALELVPLSDLRHVRVGDTVRFKVLLFGKPLQDYGAYFTASSMSFGISQPQHSRLKSGRGEIRIPAAGQWRIDVMKIAPTAEFEGMEEFQGEWEKAELAASFTFHALP